MHKITLNTTLSLITRKFQHAHVWSWDVNTHSSSDLSDMHQNWDGLAAFVKFSNTKLHVKLFSVLFTRLYAHQQVDRTDIMNVSGNPDECELRYGIPKSEV
jgi:hypothetical protein